MVADRVLIAGSRDYPRLDLVERFVRSLPEDVVIIHGGARGVDVRAGTAALLSGRVVICYAAQWERYGPRAGPMRNHQMLEEGLPDRVVVFWDGSSAGSKHMIAITRKAGIPLVVYGPDGQEGRGG